MTTDDVGRNDPCPCGSGLKYKYCCGAPQGPVDVIYVHPTKQDVDFYAEQMGSRTRPMGRPYGLIPLGLPAILNVLREGGFTVKGISYPLEMQLDRNFDLRTWLTRHRTAQIALIDLHWYEHAYGAISMARVCKAMIPGIQTVLGGLTASGFAAEILANFEAVDWVVRGDGEAPLLALVKAIKEGTSDFSGVPNVSYRRDGEIVENPRSYCAITEDLDGLNYADVDFLEHPASYLSHEYIVTDVEAARRALDAGRPYQGRWIATARGCKYECSYCGGCRSAHKTLAGREGIIPRSPEAVVDELAHMAAQGIHQASLSYDIAEMGRDYWRSLFSLMRRQKVEIGLYNEFFQLPDPSFIKHFARSVDMTHSCLAVSPLSGSERVRRLNGKQYDDAALINILDYLNLYNVPIFVYFSLNLPGEDDAAFEKTLDLAKRIYHQYPPSLLKILNSCHTMDPFSPMQQHPDKYGIEAAWSTFMDFYAYGRETQLRSPGARTGAWRGFSLEDEGLRSLERMADAWDEARQGRETSWWPLPPSW